MAQISVLLALSSPILHAKLRSEILLDPGLVLVHATTDAGDAIFQTRRHQPQVVLCDRGILADGQMATIAQQTRVVSLLVLVALNDDKSATRVPVPVAGTISVNHRPGELAERLQMIIESPASFIEPVVRIGPLRPPSQRLTLEPLEYDPSEMPSMPQADRLSWLYGAQPEQAAPGTGVDVPKNSTLSAPAELPDKSTRQDRW
jgi:DNA-binding NarL/FixJ family response regulator